MVSCDECPTFYIGQTSSSLGVRIGEHKRYHPKWTKTLFSNHCITLEHFIEFNNINVFNRYERDKRLGISKCLGIISA